MRFLAATAVTAGLALSSNASAAVNLVTNGSFETGSFAGWTLGGGDADTVPNPAAVIQYNLAAGYPLGAYGEAVPTDNAASPSPDAAGHRAAYFVGDLSNESLTQVIHLKPGVYTIGFSAYTPANGLANPNNAKFSGTIAGQNLASLSLDTNPLSGWTHFGGVANIAAEGDYFATFTFRSFGHPAKDIVIDRVYVVAGAAIPEPATWALMISGIGLAGASLRNARRRFSVV